MCIQDKGCKAFDQGLPGAFQAGDCFLSYDTDATIKSGDVRSTFQLQLSLKVDSAPINNIFFRKSRNCRIIGSNDGGSWEDEHSPEACAQICMNSPSCRSFEAGTVKKIGGQWQSKIDDCYISYETRDDPRVIDEDLYVCDTGDFGMDYYHRIDPVGVTIENLNFESITQDTRSDDDKYAAVVGVTRPQDTITDPASWDHQKQVVDLLPQQSSRIAIEQDITTAILGISGFPAGVLDGVRAAPGLKEGSTTVLVNTGSDRADKALRDQIAQGLKATVGGKEYGISLAEITLCPSGTTSFSGKVPDCKPCPVDTYANRARTACLACPIGTASPPGASNDGVKACQALPSSTDAAKGPFR